MKLIEKIDKFLNEYSSGPFTVSWLGPNDEEKEAHFYSDEEAWTRYNAIKKSINPWHQREAKAIRWALDKRDD